MSDLLLVSCSIQQFCFGNLLELDFKLGTFTPAFWSLVMMSLTAVLGLFFKAITMICPQMLFLSLTDLFDVMNVSYSSTPTSFFFMTFQITALAIPYGLMLVSWLYWILPSYVRFKKTLYTLFSWSQLCWFSCWFI